MGVGDEALCCRGGMVGERIALMGAATFPLLSCPQKLEMEIVRVVRKKIERGCEGKLS